MSSISLTITPSERCAHLNEVLNETIVKWHLLRRIKYYHLPCQRRSPPLSCFYDDTRFCFCNDYGHQRIANCFEFNYTVKHDCFGHSNCENGARCLQDKATCPQTSVCVCPTCFYGTRCQFSTNAFSFSLDAILGHHIQPNIPIARQPRIVTTSIIVSTIIMIAGLINGGLSMLTFKNKASRKSGCSVYLLGSSITSLLIVIIFELKIWILIMAQTTCINNRLFLNFQCHSIDFALRVCLSMDQWLNACVAAERAFSIIKGINFDKKKSVQMAKYIISIAFFVTCSTAIHDPIYRRLFDDNDDNTTNRIWCIVAYPFSVHVINLVMNIFHFIGPFLINLISAIIIIIMTTRQQTTVRTAQSYGKLLRKQFQKHKHLLIAPLLLVILALPRLIISFVSGCMKSTRDSWLFLIGYLVSFLPPILTFVVFVLPSKWYKKELRKSVIQYQQRIRRRLFVE